MPMPDPTGTPTMKFGFLNQRRVLALLALALLVLTAVVVWLVITVMSMKRDGDKGGADNAIDRIGRPIAVRDVPAPCVTSLNA